MSTCFSHVIITLAALRHSVYRSTWRRGPALLSALEVVIDVLQVLAITGRWSVAHVSGTWRASVPAQLHLVGVQM